MSSCEGSANWRAGEQTARRGDGERLKKVRKCRGVLIPLPFPDDNPFFINENHLPISYGCDVLKRKKFVVEFFKLSR
jgi:hypothetical protein